MNPDRENLARLLAQVIQSRYKTQAFEADDKESWIRASLEGDPLVLLEAAWEYWTKGDKGFRPTPGALHQLANKWPIERHPYVPLPKALEVTSQSPGLLALIQRFGPGRFSEARKKSRPLPSDEARWLEVNLDHRRFMVAKKRMEERGAPAWNPNEMGALAPSTSAMAALIAPRQMDEIPGLAFNAKIQGLLESVQEGK